MTRQETRDLARWARYVVSYLEDGKPEEAANFAKLVAQTLEREARGEK